MEPITAFAIATLMMMLNGGVLGLVHRDRPESLRPSARSWRISTLPMAGSTAEATTAAERLRLAVG